MSTFSPLDGRYKRDLPEVLSEEATLSFQIFVEKTWLEILMDEGLCPRVPVSKIEKAFEGITYAEIEEVEKRTQHATRALVEVLQMRLEKQKLGQIAKWVHVGLTSFDTVDTAQRLRLKSFFHSEWKQNLVELRKNWKVLFDKSLDMPQVARTHGQWAVPSLMGLMFGEALSRFNDSLNRVDGSVEQLTGQASGAVGAYQAASLLFEDPIQVEAKFLKKLNLKRHFGSTQILPPEDILALAQDVFCACSSLAKLCNDLRHLARSEISEISEGMAPGQVGSSTMPQKRNPWNLEHIGSLYKVLYSKLSLIQLDVVSEHQRDLTNSASSRFYSEYFAIAFLMIKRAARVFKNLNLHEEQCKKNLDNAGESVFAEALYVLAAKEGVKDAHDVVREASRRSEKSGKTLFSELKKVPELKKVLKTEDALRESIMRGPRRKVQALKKLI